ncbi:hypothetical protein ACFLSJ_04755 [Verrucomicrobiota bacterium]
MRKVWSEEKGLALRRQTRGGAAAGLEAVADWAVRNQVRHAWPRWDANAGRFPYHVYLPTDDTFLSTSWNTARTAQGLLSAYRVLGNAEYLTAAERALEYVKSLQVFSPEHGCAAGAFIEETPLGDHVGARDGMECAQALLAHHVATRNKTSLVRAGAFLDWLMKEHASDAWPEAFFYLAGGKRPPGGTDSTEFIYAAGAIPLVQYAGITGSTKYVSRCAVPMVNFVLDRIQQPDGAFRLGSPVKNNHHAPAPGDATIYNDDGVGVALLCVWKATGKRKYLDAAVANGDWWLSHDPGQLPCNYAMLPCAAIFMADLARAVNEDRYVGFIEAVADRLFALQILRDERSLVTGAFRGEDMAQTYRSGSDPGDYISLRSTAYGLLALGKLAAGNSKQWGPSYSAYGF